MAVVSWSSKKASALPAPVEIIGVFSTPKSEVTSTKQLTAALGKNYKSVLTSVKFTGELEQTVLIPGSSRAVLVVGLGEAKKLTFSKLRRASATAVRAVSSFPSAIASYGETAATVLPSDEVATAIFEGLSLGSYSYAVYKEKNTKPLKKVTISDATKQSTVAALKRASVVSDSVMWARDAINTPPNAQAPKDFAALVQTLVKGTTVKVDIIDEAGLKRKKMAGVLAVGSGSENRPRFVRLSYKAAGAKKTLAFVGKGVVFDSGGLSIKPGDAMTTMKCDMSGAAAVAGALKAIATLKPKVNIEGYIPLVENMPSGSAYRVDDIISYRNGVTVEVQNTDAEGRLILADALIEASQAKPDAIVDLATLTGACVVALGDHIAAVMSNDDKFRSKVTDAADIAGERFWPLPLPEDYRSMIDTPVAHVANAGPRWAGTITAGLFLQEFVDGVTWAHLDIAGPAFLSKTDGENIEGGTGFGIRTLVRLAESFA